MGSDKAEKERAKLEKKRLKAQIKAEKARAKAGLPPEPAKEEPPAPVKIQPETAPAKGEKWYKDPNWIRAILALATLVVTIIALFLAI